MNYLLLEQLEAKTLFEAIQQVEFVQIDGSLFETEYARMPDEFTEPDDILLELRNQRGELLFTHKELDQAQYLGDGMYQLLSGCLLQLLISTTVH